MTDELALDKRVNGWLAGRPSQEETQEGFDRVWLVKEKIQWILGDILNYAESNFGEEWTQLIPDDPPRAKTSLAEYMRVARTIPPVYRHFMVSWSHYQVVSKRTLTMDERVMWLEQAEQHQWPLEVFREKVPGYRQVRRFVCKFCGADERVCKKCGGRA